MKKDITEAVAPTVKQINETINLIRLEHVKWTETQEIEGNLVKLEYCPYCYDTYDVQVWPCGYIAMIDHYTDIMGVVANLRDEVLEFAEAMEAKLKKHDGDKTGWIMEDTALSLSGLRKSLHGHMMKLDLSAIGWPYDYERIMSNAADVGNFAMMIYDNARAWKEREDSSDEA